MSGNIIDFDPTDGWGNVILLRIFSECDSHLLARSTVSTNSSTREVPVSAIVEYIEENLPTSRTDLLEELRKSLEAVASDGFVSWEQFKEASQYWCTKIDPFKCQDGNNNTYKENQKGTALRAKIRQIEEENSNLRDEVVKTEELVTILRRQRDSLKRKLDRCGEKCQQLEKENDEQRVALNDVIKKERASSLALEKSLKECKSLQRKLETTEAEATNMVQTISPLNVKLEKLTKERMEFTKQITQIRDELDEKQQECAVLKMIIEKLEENYSSLRQAQEQRICDLRDRNRQLMDENTELQSLSMTNMHSFEDKFMYSPYLNVMQPSMYDGPFKSDRAELENSLYLELKASGFTAECNKNDSRNRELEEELNIYNEKCRTALEQLEIIVQKSAIMWGIKYKPILQLEDVDNSRMQNLEALNQKTSFLLHMLTEVIAKNTSKHCSTQVRAESSTVEDNFRSFGILTFHDLLKVKNFSNAHTVPSFSRSENDFANVATEEYLTVNNGNDAIEKTCPPWTQINAGDDAPSGANTVPVPLSFSTPMLPKKLCPTTNERKPKNILEVYSRRNKRRLLTAERSLLRGDSGKRTRSIPFRKFVDEKSHQNELAASFTLFDTRSDISSMNELPKKDTFHEENLPGAELENKYATFSVGFNSDAMTLQRRLTLSVHQRDLSELNFTTEVRQTQQDIQDDSWQRASVCEEPASKNDNFESEKWEDQKTARISRINETRKMIKSVQSRTVVLKQQDVEPRSTKCNDLIVASQTNANLTEDTYLTGHQTSFPELSIIKNLEEESQSRVQCFRKYLHAISVLTKHRWILYCIFVFFLGFYVSGVISSFYTCDGSSPKWWSIEEALDPYLRFNNPLPPI